MSVFVHDEMLSAANPLLEKPFPKLFVFDPQIHGTWSLNRLQFVADSLSEMPVSYTHLDVYKRQVVVWLSSNILVNRMVSAGQLP